MDRERAGGGYLNILRSKQFLIGLAVGVIFLILPVFIYSYLNIELKSKIGEELKLQNDAAYFTYSERVIKPILIKIIKYENEKPSQNKKLDIEIRKLKYRIGRVDIAAANFKSDLARNKSIEYPEINKAVFKWLNIDKPILQRFIAHPKLMSKKSSFISVFLRRRPLIFSILKITNKNIPNYFNNAIRRFNIVFFIGAFIISFLILLLSYLVSKRDLKLSEQKKIFNAILEHTTDTIVVKDPSGTYLMASKNVKEFHFDTEPTPIVSKTDDEIKSRSFQKGDFFKTLETADEVVWETKTSYNFLLRLYDKNKSPHTFDVTKIPLFDEKGGRLMSIAVGRDITDEMEREKQFKSMFYDNSLPMFTFDVKTLVLLKANESAVKYGGYPEGEVIGKTLCEIDPFITKDIIFQLLDKFKEGKQKTFGGLKFPLKNGEVRDIEVSLTLIYKKDVPIAVATILDVTEKLANESKIKSLKRLYQSLIKEVSLILNPESENAVFHRTLVALQKSGIFNASWIGRLEGDGTIRYIYAKGRGTQELMKIKLSADCDKKFLTLAERAICFNRIFFNNDHISDQLINPYLDFLIKNEWFSACAAPIHRAGKMWGVIVLISDKKNIFGREIIEFVSKISALLSHSLNEIDIKKELEKERIKSEYLAHHDALTGLPNRILLTNLLEGALKRADRNKTYVGVGIIDFDDFKHINDTFGHDEGDNLLKEFAKRVKNILRGMDYLARLGGDEFIIIMEDLKNKDDVYILMPRLEEAFAKPIIIKGQDIYLKISLGITLYPIDKQPPSVLLVHADNAMYGIKAKKGDRKTFWQLYEE